ncbi:protein of unknown function [Tindallia magadiensis]|uniref:DUF3784 domain-containing protein n=1 Tax=Tindallia magadiensis TaxID=69895 RepID=A0A1I3GQA0_9FIRM|nr:DUF3784 domain-containing protein [Tindallia magadiensis]SFI25668.1 protein of unknown function [Tindallia magadiensis]
MFASALLIMTGIIFIGIGWRIWKKEDITLIHAYHYAKVPEEDKKPYTERIGKACMVIGKGIILAEIFNFATNTGYGWFVFIIFFAWGMTIAEKAQKRYNKGWF